MALNPSETPLTPNPGYLDVPPLGMPSQNIRNRIELNGTDGGGDGCGGAQSGDEPSPLPMINEINRALSAYIKACCGSEECQCQARFQSNGGGDALDRAVAVLGSIRVYAPPSGGIAGAGC